VGNAPVKEQFLNLLKEATTEHNCEIVVTSQCKRGHVDISLYASGRVFKDLGLINGGDMTMPALVTKLSYLMGKGYRKQDLKKAFESPLCGEMTPAEEIHGRIVDYRRHGDALQFVPSVINR